MAIAELPPQSARRDSDSAGLRFERYFTKDGVHPYDEIVWELRDAVIPGEGGNVFEQKGVEVPAFWSMTATNVVASKYFRGKLGTPARETSVRQMVDRVVDTITRWGVEKGYFAGGTDAAIFSDELKYLMVHQHASFNSPVWFNIGVPGARQQAAACFILSVDDSMDSILDWFKTEGVIFKGGSGSGINVSTIRSSKEYLSGGGLASGPVSFMRGADSVAGSIKSGGTTRRAAKMVVLNTDHPDVREFIWCKAKEEQKAWALGEQGYDMGLNGEAWQSIQFQNANNSVRATDDFMRAALSDEDWQLKAVSSGETLETVKARQLLREISEATWACGDPGMQFDTTINDWHTRPVSGRINGSNPCFPGDARVHTTVGLLPIAELFERTKAGEDIAVYTHRATAPVAADGVVSSLPLAVMQNGTSAIVRLRFSNGAELRCTPNHRIWTKRGWVEAQALTEDDEVLLNDSPTPAEEASWRLPVKVERLAVSRKRGGTATVYRELPDRWSEGLAELTGHLIGDGSLTPDTTAWVYGQEDIGDGLLASHEGLLTELVGGVTHILMDNDTDQLRVGSAAVRELFHGLGVTSDHSATKHVPHTIFTAPVDIQAAFLRGLYGADGCVSRVEGGKANRYVGLGSHSERLLKDVQRLLSTFGIRARLYRVSAKEATAFDYTRRDGTSVSYESGEAFDLRITGTDVERFAATIGFSAPRKQAALDQLIGDCERYQTKPYTQLEAREDDGQAIVYNLNEPLHHSYLVDGFVVANCSEYMSLDDTACNLASLNLMRFRRADGEFDTERFTRAVDLVFTAQEILVGSTEYPTAKITANAHANRELGIGYANLGAILMDRGLAYDSDEGRGYAAAITALMTGESYAQSARMAGVVGPYDNYPSNREGHDRVMEMHRLHAYRIREEIVPSDLLGAARQAWDDAVAIGKVNGYRNAQASVLAPTGCLVGDSLISTSRGLVRLRSLGDVDGQKWQALDHVDVATDQGPRRATQFYVNGSEQVVSVESSRGYRIQGTPSHRVKVVDPDGNWMWKRFAEIRVGDRVPLMLGQMVGDPVTVALPPLGELHWNAGPRTRVPETVTPALGEFVGYFMGDGSLHAKGLRLTVTAGDHDVIDRLVRLGEELFGLSAQVEDEGKGDVDIYFNSVPLTMWWQACGFAKRRPNADHTGKGWTPHVPDAILHTNDRDVYAAFVRGLFEADGTVSTGYASFSTVTESFTRDVQSVLLVLGFVTTRKVDEADSNWGTHARYVLRLLNVAAATRFADEIGFISKRKSDRLLFGEHRQASRMDHIPSLARRGDVSRRAATALLERTADPDLEHLLGFFYDTVASTELLADEPTFDLSVPDNVTYVANGFISHNTISFMMDCDTTGVEPDIALVKYKKLVGGGMLKLVNQTVPSALAKLGYTESQVTAITAHIEATGTIEGAPDLADEHLSIFDCAFKPQNGTRSISHLGHIKMMGSVQPFISGAISKTCNVPETASVEDVMDAYVEAWKHGVKAIAIYRDGSKKVQPLSTGKETSNSKKDMATVMQTVEVPRPRRRLNDTRASLTHKFTIEGHEGYITVGLFEDNTPGEIFVTMAKEGSTLSGMMDAFATSISLSLQYGVPLAHLVEKFAHMRFEPSGWTGNSELGFAKSIVDYVFRWLGYRFLSADDKLAIGLVHTSEIVDPAPQLELLSKAVSMAAPITPASAETVWSQPVAPSGPGARRMNSTPDAPPCPRCGWLTVRNGTCHKCENCGETTGCS